MNIYRFMHLAWDNKKGSTGIHDSNWEIRYEWTESKIIIFRFSSDEWNCSLFVEYYFFIFDFFTTNDTSKCFCHFHLLLFIFTFGKRKAKHCVPCLCRSILWMTFFQFYQINFSFCIYVSCISFEFEDFDIWAIRVSSIFFEGNFFLVTLRNKTLKLWVYVSANHFFIQLITS